MSKLTQQEKAARLAHVQQKEQRAREARARKERMKKIFILAVAIVLVIGLSLPTMALVVMGGH